MLSQPDTPSTTAMPSAGGRWRERRWRRTDDPRHQCHTQRRSSRSRPCRRSMSAPTDGAACRRLDDQPPGRRLSWAHASCAAPPHGCSRSPLRAGCAWREVLVSPSRSGRLAAAWLRAFPARASRLRCCDLHAGRDNESAPARRQSPGAWPRRYRLRERDERYRSTCSR